MSLEPPSNSVVDTLRLAPVCVNAFVAVALVTVEALRACNVEGQYVLGFLIQFSRPKAGNWDAGAASSCERRAVFAELEARFNLRFFTILMCFFAAAICIR